MEQQATTAPDLRKPIHLLAFGFGSGLAPKAPGTFGTLVAIPIYLLLQPLSFTLYLVLLLLGFVVGIWICGQASKDLGVHDHGGIVWDEIVGYLVTMSFASDGVWWILIGFVLFRFFDILKPWPINWLDQQVHGGFGIMLDDLVAGLYAGSVMLLIQWGAF
ncbi:MAG: phosphatidylglycerophosphatase A [Candidatus Thiodiazotropha sp. (ex Gloverina cf. vestifex)]|nr:phosphatidylglycerophosphatase A [Candidatus Thiodiazotropha sp. (ex Gloverina cf. vestifex)]